MEFPWDVMVEMVIILVLVNSNDSSPDMDMLRDMEISKYDIQMRKCREFSNGT